MTRRTQRRGGVRAGPWRRPSLESAPPGSAVLTYLLISLRQSVHCSLERPTAALLGAAPTLLLGAIGPAEALAAIEAYVIFLLRRT